MACPQCKEPLKLSTQTFTCSACKSVYQIQNGIPNFVRKSNWTSQEEMLSFFDSASSHYDTIDYSAFIYSFYGGLNVLPPKEKVPEIHRFLKQYINSLLKSSGGIVLDAACGTGRYSRSLAHCVNQVIGVDLAWGMIEKAYSITKDEYENITFIRAMIEKLPFKDAFFDGVACCGALQLLPNLDAALTEINRVLKVKGIMAGFTYLRNISNGDEHLRNYLENTRRIHFFEVDELKDSLSKNGFINFEYEILGSIILFSSIKI